MNTIGVRREDKHQWEARAPLTPRAVEQLSRQGLQVIVQPSSIRAFGDEAYRAAGAKVSEDLEGADIVFAVKELPKELLRAGGAYVFFSHTIKGQPQNMPMLRRLLELGCTLIDYERIVDAQGRRLVFFGRHAGLAGMIDTLAVLGRRLSALGHETPFAELSLAHEHSSLQDAQDKLRALGEALEKAPLPAALRPFVVGFAGYGNVSQGAQELYDLLGPRTVSPDALPGLKASEKGLFKVVFEERHLVEPRDDSATFDLQEYFQRPARYRSIFARHAPYLSVLINAIYWTKDYPRLLTKVQLQELFASGRPRLLLIGDISCDIEGSIESTVKATTPGLPAYVYSPRDGKVVDGYEGEGLCMMTTDTLPCELPKESSSAFTEALLPFIPDLAKVDLGASFEAARLPEPIRRATIVWRGALTPEYAHLKAHLQGA